MVHAAWLLPMSRSSSLVALLLGDGVSVHVLECVTPCGVCVLCERSLEEGVCVLVLTAALSDPRSLCLGTCMVGSVSDR